MSTVALRMYGWQKRRRGQPTTWRWWCWICFEVAVEKVLKCLKNILKYVWWTKGKWEFEDLAYGGRKLQRDGVRKSDNAETKEVEYESFKSDSIKRVVEHWERKFYVLNVFQEMYNITEGYKDVYIPVSERRVQWKSNDDKDYLQ